MDTHETPDTTSRQFVTDSRDPDVLQELLARARERIAFYHHFDRQIQENLEHSRQLMAEAAAARDRAVTPPAQPDPAPTGPDAAALARARAELTEIRARMDALAALLDDPAASAGPQRLAPEIDDAVADLVARQQPEAPQPAPADGLASASPPEMDIIAHGVPGAVTAIDLQNFLKNHPATGCVDIREYADGELRLHIITHGPFSGTDLTAWLAGHGGRLVQETPSAIELHFR